MRDIQLPSGDFVTDPRISLIEWLLFLLPSIRTLHACSHAGSTIGTRLLWARCGGGGRGISIHPTTFVHVIAPQIRLMMICSLAFLKRHPLTH